MKNNIVVEVKNISKTYIINTSYVPNTLREKLVDIFNFPRKIYQPHQSKKIRFEALKNVSFQVKKGEVLGIIGKNGAGKSTLLKILSRVTDPTSGEITMRGKVASMLEVGTGFNPELTGRENIYLNGSIIGMTKKEIERKFDDIVKFADIGDFIDTPVKRYSSGMYVRLAFAVSAHLDSDIMIIDEVLSVGDREFQKKSLAKMKNLTQSGRTVIFVSHDISAVSRFCNRAILLQKGKIVGSGETEKIVSSYISDGQINKIMNIPFAGSLSHSVFVKDIKIKNSQNELDPSDPIQLRFNWKTTHPWKGLCMTCSVYDEKSVRLFSAHDVNTANSEITKPGEYQSEYIIPKNLLRPGLYTVGFGGYANRGLEWMYSEDVIRFRILERWDDLNIKENVGLFNVPVYTARKPL